MSAPTDRRWRDPRGTRRASVEFNGKSPGRKPREKRRKATRHEGRGARLGRRMQTIGRAAAKRRGSLLFLLGSLAAVLSLVLLEGAVQIVSVLLSLAIAGTGAAIRHHHKTQLMNRNPNVEKPTWRKRRTMTNNGRNGNYFDGTPHQQAGGPVTVTSHDRDTGKVRSYTRARPGQASGGGDAA